MIFILACILIFGFFSLFIVIVPWMNWARSPDWEAMAIDNLLMGLIGAAIIYGIYIGSKTM
jgi:hypothetical protein